MRATTLKDVESWLEQIALLRKQQKCSAPFIKPFHLATLCMMSRHGILTLPDFLKGYAARMNLWGLWNHPVPKNFRFSAGIGRFIPLKPLANDKDVSNIADEVKQFFASTSPETQDAIWTAVSEISENARKHSEVKHPISGTFCAQSWIKGNRAQFVVCDDGIGIRPSFVRANMLIERLATENACQVASELQISSKLGKGHSGYGLTVVRDLARIFNASLIVVSNNEGYEVRGTYEANKVIPNFGWNGTMIIFEWELSCNLNVSKVYSGWPKEEDESDDFF